MSIVSVYLETERHPTKAGFYELIQAWEKSGVTGVGKGEVIKEWETDDRLLAAIINLGLACRGLAELQKTEMIYPYVDIKTDIDGKSYRHEKEHDKLYYLLFPDNGNEAKKVHSLYREYLKYLYRIKELAEQCHIVIRLEP